MKEKPAKTAEIQAGNQPASVEPRGVEPLTSSMPLVGSPDVLSQISRHTGPVEVWYHAGCADGFAAALACWMRWKDHAQYVPVRYEQLRYPEPPAGSLLLLVDFSLPPDQLEALANRVKALVVVDHHASSEWLAVATMPERVNAIHVQGKSGCRLTWELLYPHLPLPPLLKLIEDRDLWAWKYGDETKQCHAALMTLPWVFDVWHEHLGDTTKICAVGKTALAMQQKNVHRQANAARLVEVNGETVPLVNATVDMSETAHELLQRYPDAPFCAVYADRQEDGRSIRAFSLRSRKGGFDVSKLAEACGGGGHPTAAGFALPLDENIFGQEAGQ